LERVTPHEDFEIFDDAAHPLLLEHAGGLFHASRDGIRCGTGCTILWKPFTQSVGRGFQRLTSAFGRSIGGSHRVAHGVMNGCLHLFGGVFESALLLVHRDSPSFSITVVAPCHRYAQGNGLRSAHELGKALVAPVEA
jgi:hypothetical protein